MKKRMFNEDLFTLGTRLGEISRLIVIVAEDTEERAYSKEDVRKNMGTLRVLSDELDRLERVCKRWDALRVKAPEILIDVL